MSTLPHVLAVVPLALALNSGEPAKRPDLAARIIGTALVEGRAYDRLTHLTDRIGHRLSGSAALERAVEWAAAEMRRDGIDRVWTEPVKVPHWVRGEAAARIVAPAEHEMALLALGGSVATAPGGLEAEVVRVDGFEQLEAAGETVRGRIVLFDRAMEPGFGGYGSVAKLRSEGPSRAARLGAVGMLIRSLGTADYRLPHTGALRYAEEDPRIPAAAITAEDAELIGRLLAAGGAVRVKLELGCKTLPDADSANVLGEIVGREKPEEIVLIGAHLDSWDVGQGAHDDGAGSAVVLETMRLIKRLGLAPRRTIRAVLFTNEENGLRGAVDYVERHGAEMHVAAIETDSGAERPTGFGITAGEGAVEMLRELTRPLAAIEADHVHPRGGGADISKLKPMGVPLISQLNVAERYFHYHHTAADTLDKVRREDLDRHVAAMALLVVGLAEQEATLPRLDPERAEDP